MPDIATVNTSGRITIVVRPITAIICPTTVLIGPVRAIIGRVTRTIGHMPAIIGGLTATLRFTGITSGRVRFDESMGVGTSMNGRVLLTGEGLNDAETVNTMDPAKPEIIPIYSATAYSGLAMTNTRTGWRSSKTRHDQRRGASGRRRKKA